MKKKTYIVNHQLTWLNSSFVLVDDVTNRKSKQCTCTIEHIIALCQLLGLIAIHPPSPCGKGHEDWCLGAAENVELLVLFIFFFSVKV